MSSALSCGGGRLFVEVDREGNGREGRIDESPDFLVPAFVLLGSRVVFAEGIVRPVVEDASVEAEESVELLFIGSEFAKKGDADEDGAESGTIGGPQKGWDASGGGNLSNFEIAGPREVKEGAADDEDASSASAEGVMSRQTHPDDERLLLAVVLPPLPLGFFLASNQSRI